MTDKMAMNLDMFGLFMEDIIVNNLNDTLVITKSDNWCEHTYTLGKPTKPKEFKCNVSKGTIFSLVLECTTTNSFWLRQDVRDELKRKQQLVVDRQSVCLLPNQH